MPLKLDPVPENFEDAISQLAGDLTEDEKDYIRANSSATIHFGGGMSLRNAWNLWGAQPDKPTALLDEFKSRFTLGHADDISGFILDALWAHVRNEPFDRDAEIARYHAHWATYGVDPVTQEKLP